MASILLASNIFRIFASTYDGHLRAVNAQILEVFSGDQAMAANNGTLPANKMNRGTLMKGIIAAMGSAVVMACSGCGGGGGGGESAVPAATAAPAPAQSQAATTITIDAEGDSTMYGTQSTNGLNPYQTPFNPPALMQQNLQSYVGSGVTVINNAKPGTSLSNRLFGTFGDAGVTWQQYLDATPFQIVIENFGLNDANPNNVWNESPADFQWDLTVFATAAVKAGRIVVFEEPNPCADPVWNAKVAQYTQIIDQVAAQYNIPLVKQYDYIMSLPSWQSLLIDGLHPTPQLYEIKASREVAVLLPIVKSLMPQ